MRSNGFSWWDLLTRKDARLAKSLADRVAIRKNSIVGHRNDAMRRMYLQMGKNLPEELIL